MFRAALPVLWGTPLSCRLRASSPQPTHRATEKGFISSDLQLARESVFNVGSKDSSEANRRMSLTTKSTAATLNNIHLDLFYIGFQQSRAQYNKAATSFAIRSAGVCGERITSTDSILTCSVFINLEALVGNRSAHSTPPFEGCRLFFYLDQLHVLTM
jgi:hypothetical protein